MLDELAWAPGAGVSGVDIANAGGVVTLSGQVDIPTTAMLFSDAEAEVGAMLAGLHAYVP